jgi:hypothetical protein
MALSAISGEPGERWLNDKGVVYWQIFTSLVNVCGSCLQHHGKIAPYWGIPWHRGCRCYLKPVAPCQYSQPFVSFRKLLESMGESAHDAAVGKANWKLIQAGLVKWSDVVTDYRVRSLHEVVAREKITVAEMIKAKIDRKTAEEAYAMVHTPAHQIFEAQIKKAAGKLKEAGLTDEQIVRGFAEKIVPRITGISPQNVKPIEIPKGQKVDWEGSRIEGGPVAPIVAGNVILERIRRGTATEPIRMPDFHGSTTTMWEWVTKTFPDTVDTLSKEDWAALVLAVEAQEKLRPVFKKLNIDPEKAFKAIQ